MASSDMEFYVWLWGRTDRLLSLSYDTRPNRSSWRACSKPEVTR